jgi:hypothetical protein
LVKFQYELPTAKHVFETDKSTGICARPKISKRF